MTSSRPYLVRAIREWIVDNSFTPQLIVDADVDGVSVPTEHVRDGKIVLNVSDTAVRGLTMDNEWVSFDARFSGRPMSVAVPMCAVLAVYAKENGVGMAFQDEEDDPTPTPDDDKPQRPALRIVK